MAHPPGPNPADVMTAAASALQRCFRDMFTGGRHVFVDFKSYEEIAKGKLGVA